MDIKLVIARYQENIDWVKKINSNIDVIVYNKFYHDQDNYLINVGREGHTYLNHIINNYNRLNDYTIFSQGDPFCHCPNFLQELNIINDELTSDNLSNQTANYLKFLCPSAYEGIYSNFHKSHESGLPMYYFFDLLFNIKLKTTTKLKVYYGAQFITHKNNILNKPLAFYQFLIKFLSYETNPIEGYIFERLWPYILDSNIKLSEKYKLWIQ
jgi:hypothetical protein